MTTLAELIKQKEALDAQITLTRQAELSEAISKVKSLVAEYDLKPIDIFKIDKSVRKSAGKTKAAAKYYDPSSGKSWTGRGREPKWLHGKDRSQYLIA